MVEGIEKFDESVSLNSVLRRADGCQDFRIRKTDFERMVFKGALETVKDLE